MTLSEAKRNDGDLRFGGSFRIGKMTGGVAETYIGHSGSYSIPNPMDLVLQTACKLLDASILLDLPADWTPKTVRKMAIETGVLHATIELDAQQMTKLIELAREILRICEASSLFEVPDDAGQIDVAENPSHERKGR